MHRILGSSNPRFQRYDLQFSSRIYQSYNLWLLAGSHMLLTTTGVAPSSYRNYSFLIIPNVLLSLLVFLHNLLSLIWYIPQLFWFFQNHFSPLHPVPPEVFSRPSSPWNHFHIHPALWSLSLTVFPPWKRLPCTSGMFSAHFFLASLSLSSGSPITFTYTFSPLEIVYPAPQVFSLPTSPWHPSLLHGECPWPIHWHICNKGLLPLFLYFVGVTFFVSLQENWHRLPQIFPRLVPGLGGLGWGLLELHLPSPLDHHNLSPLRITLAITPWLTQHNLLSE